MVSPDAKFLVLADKYNQLKNTLFAELEAIKQVHNLITKQEGPQGPIGLSGKDGVNGKDGVDLLAASGNVYIEGTLNVTESLEDTLEALGEVLVSGSLAATEVGDDIFQAESPQTIRGSISALEDGEDAALFTGIQYFEYPLEETVLLGVRYGPGGIYVGTATGGGGGTRIEISSGRIVKLIGDTGAYLT